jgi:hypothetical protein
MRRGAMPSAASIGHVTSRLPLLLGSADLPSAELQAMRLDGELSVLHDGAFLPAGVPVSADFRGRALRRSVPRGHIAELITAAWVLGASPAVPHRLQLCISTDRRARVRPRRGADIRQVVLGADDVVAAGPLPVTSPLRTAFDLLRGAPSLDRPLAHCITTLLLAADLPWAECRSRLSDSAHLPHKHRALAHLDALAL